MKKIGQITIPKDSGEGWRYVQATQPGLNISQDSKEIKISGMTAISFGVQGESAEFYINGQSDNIISLGPAHILDLDLSSENQLIIQSINIKKKSLGEYLIIDYIYITNTDVGQQEIKENKV